MLLHRSGQWGRVVAETLRDLFFPAHCVHCEMPTEGDWLCPTCRKDINPVPDPKCPVCSHAFSGTSPEFLCVNCGDRQFYFDSAVAVWRGQGVLRDLIHRLKYDHATWLAEPLAGLMVDGFTDARLADQTFDALVPVPLHLRRQRERGHNQAAGLARELSRKTAIPTRNLLQRTRYTVTQTHFDRQERMQNLRDAFSLRQNAHVLGQNLLLVDDVFTTGSTLDECARVLTSAGAKTVCALTLARG